MIDLEILDKSIRRVPDFPKPGIMFYDVTSIFTNPPVFKYCIDKMLELCKEKNIDGIAGIESRGFLFAAPLAEKLGCKYSLEYGTAEIEVHKEDIKKKKNYLVVDDLIATGGTLSAAKNLIEQGGAKVTDILGVIGLPFLNYEKNLAPLNITTLINYDSE